MDEVFRVLLPAESSEFRTVCREVAAHKERLAQLEGEVLECLPKEACPESYIFCTDRVVSFVEQKNEVWVNELENLVSNIFNHIKKFLSLI